MPPLDITNNGPLDITYPPDGQPGGGGGTPDDGSVTAAKLASDAVETAKILGGAVTEAKLAAAVQTKLNLTRDGLSRVNPFIFNDFLSPTSTTLAPYLGTAVASGTVAIGTTGEYDANHPGVIRIASSTTTNSGFHIGSSTGALLLGGAEEAIIIWRPSVFANTTTRAGFHDANSSTAPVDGCWIEVDTSGVASGKTSNNSTASTTGTTFQLVAGTWYRFCVTLNAAATSVTFEITNDAGTVLWTDTLSANIPTASGRETGIAFISTNVGTTATGLSTLDYMSYICRRTLARGGA
jgi:hypothetical protein